VKVRCRSCGAAMSLRCPVVQLATGLLFFYFVSKLGLSLAALKMCDFTAMLVGLIFSDLEKRILPDQFTKGGIAIGLAFALFVPVPDSIAEPLYWLVTQHDLPDWIKPLAESAFGALLPALFLWAGGWLYFKIRHREGLGFGDV